jgi:glycosyltransferase involved in cell wall biosynthesis
MPVATNRSSISIFFPAFNDEGTIAGLVRNALDLLPALTTDYQVLVINDGSTDGTAAVIDALAAA